MADKKISELPASTALDTNDLLAVVEDGTTVKATVQDLIDLIPSSSEIWSVPTFTPSVGTDQTSTMTAAIDALPDEGGIVMIPRGTFYTQLDIDSTSGVTFRGTGVGATTLVGPTSGTMISVTGLPRGDLTFEDLTFDLGSADGVMVVYPDDHNVTFRRCRFINITNYGVTCNGSVNPTFEDCEFDDGATATGTAVTCNNGVRGLRWIRSKVRFMNGGLNFDASPHDEIDVDGGLFDGGWYLLPTRGAGYTNSGGTVTYAATTVTDSAASFATLSTPNDVNVRALPVLESGSTGTSYFANYLEDATAAFVTALVKPGHIVRTSTKWAVVSRVFSETKLYVEEWFDRTTYRPTDPPAAAAAYNVHRVLFGIVASNTGTVITVERWIDFYDGASVTSAAGTLYEVLIDHGEYSGIHAAASDPHDPGGIRRIRIGGGCHLTRNWNDQLSIYGSDARLVVEPSVLIDHGYDFGITSHSDHARIYGTVVHHGACNIACTGADSRVEAFVSGAPYVNVVNVLWLGDLVISGSRTRASGTVAVASGAGARYGIVVYGTTADGAVDAVDLTGTSADGYSVAEYKLYGDAAAMVTNTNMRDVAGVTAEVNTTGTVATDNSPGPILKSGWYASVKGPVSNKALNVGSTIVFVVPFAVEWTFTADRIGVNVVTNVNPSTVRLGIYTDTGGIPGTLILDAGTVSCAATGFAEATISQALSTGRVWLVCVQQSGAGNVTVTGSSAPAIGVPSPTSGWFPFGEACLESGGGTSGALPSACPTMTGVGAVAPKIGLRIV